MITTADILKLTKQLFPTGRAWKIPFGSDLEKLLEALNESETRAINFGLSALYRILPDNENFTADDATQWERRLGLPVMSSYTPLETKKQIIWQKYQFPGNFLNRQNYRYIEYQLQLAGFNVYVHENLNGAIDLINSGTRHSFSSHHGWNTEMGGGSIDMVANSAYPNEQFGISENKSLFFICGESYPDPATISPDLKITFRKLILKLKPVNTVAVLIINWEHSGDLYAMNGKNLYAMNDENLVSEKYT